MTDIPQLKRVRYFAGELLTADDLTASADWGQQLRWLHNRTLHDWGIGFGLDVLGERGDTSVTVNPGYAVDIEGREIIMAVPVRQPIPAVPGGPGGAAATYYLVANYVSDDDEPTEESREASACGFGGAVRLSNAPAIRWKTAARLTLGIDIILAEVSIKNCVLASAVSTAPRRYARSKNASTLGAGELHAKDAHWQAWAHGGTNLGFLAAVDTSAMRFQSTPRYIVQIIGRRVLDNPVALVADFTSIANQTRDGFTLQVALPAMAGGVNPPVLTSSVTGPTLLVELDWRIVWLGVES